MADSWSWKAISALGSIVYKKGLGNWIKYLKNPEEANEEIAKEALKVFGKAFFREKEVRFDNDFSLGREIRREEIASKILEEIPYIKVEKKKVLGIIPSTSVSMNPGYEEFFHGKLGEYGVNEIYSVLKDLERRLSGENREKVKALTREFKRREGISRKRKLGVLAILLIGAAVATGAYYLHRKLAKETTTTSTTPSQTSSSTTTKTVNGKPKIYSLKTEKIPDKGIVEILVKASDFSGIEKALIEINGKNASMTKLSEGLYGFNVSMGEDPTTLPIRIYVVDKYNKSSSVSGEINWSLEDAYTYWATEQGIPPYKAKEFYSTFKELVKYLYSENREELIPPLRLYNLNATLLENVKQKIYSGNSVKNKPKILLEVSKALYELQEKSLNDASINYLGNLTNYLGTNPTNVFDKSTMWNVLNVTERNPIIITGLSKKYWLKDHDTYILTYLVNKTPESTKYPYVLWALSSQAGEIARLINKKHPAVLFAVKGYIDNFNITDTYGTDYSYIQLVNIRLNQIIRNYKNGLWLIGVEPSEILKKSGDKLTSDLWMKQVVMPFSIISGDALKGDRLPYIYPELAESFPQKAVLLVFRDNLEAIDKFSKIISDYLDGKLTWVDKWGRKWDVESWSRHVIESESRYNKEAGRDWQTLYEKGSELAKMGAKIIFGNFGNPWVVEKYGISPIKMEEFRVSQSIITGATVGVPIFANTVKDYGRIYHGMSSTVLTQEDYDLLKSVDFSPLMWDPTTRELLRVATRKNANYINLPIGRKEPYIVLWRMSYPVIGMQKPDTEWVVIFKLKK
ncbi:MAG: hypothetical protein B6U76_08645 [Desulfurococcales archaeon ex4484_217_2]|nr:MAG: hypothetical protein B6U76_08645 [Desulfurococcales archaeon ex4484_217_2]